MVETSTNTASGYRLTWGHYPDSIEVTGGTWRKTIAQSLLYAVPIVLVLGHPTIAAATGVSRAELAAITFGHMAYRVVMRLFVIPHIRTSKRAFDALVVGNALAGSGLGTALVVASGDPSTLFWIAPVMYATMNGALADFEPSVALHLLHVGSVLASIPIFLSMGAPVGWSIAGPVVAAAFCALGYHHVADLVSAMRAQRRAREREIEMVRAQMSELERKRLMRDLHDSVGSALGVTALYAQLLEEHADDPQMLRNIGSALRETAQSGLGDLRGMLEALDPAAGDARSLAASLEWLGTRACAATDASLAVRCTRGGEIALPGPVRVALVRIFQEALSNALRHSGATRVDVSVEARPMGVRMRVEDDGCGLAAGGRTRGKGLRGMLERAEELGGTTQVESAPGEGTSIEVELPLDERASRALPAALSSAPAG